MSVVMTNLTHQNIQKEGFFCFMSKRKNPGWKEKADWLCDQFSNGLVLKKLQLPDRGFIEYVPGEYAMRPVNADGYIMVHCLWVVGKSKGKGYAKAFLEECIRDARMQGKHGVSMVVSDIGYMKWKGFLQKFGFQSVDTAPHTYELMALRFDDHPAPTFSGHWEEKATICGDGVTILKTQQCPYFYDFTNDLVALAAKKQLPVKIIEFKTAADVRDKAPTPYGTYNVVINGKAVPIFYDAKKVFERIV